MFSIKPLFQIRNHLQSYLLHNRFYYGRRLEAYKSVDEVLRCKGKRQIYPHKFFYKFLYRTKKQNPFFVKPPVGAPCISFEDAVRSSADGRVAESRRIIRFNKIFMQYIPQILATSEVGFPLDGYDLQISDVKMNQHFSVIHVYWIPTGNEEKDKELEAVLNEVSYPLRKELINSRLMGLVPPIVFKRDEKWEYLKTLDRLIATADYGENFVKSYLNENRMRQDLQLEINMPVDLKDALIELDTNETFTEDEQKNIPPMRTNVFGLNHDRIMKNILECKKHHYTLGRNSSDDSDEVLINRVAKKIYLQAETIENWNRFAYREYIKRKKLDRKRILKVAQRELADLERELAENEIFVEEKPNEEDLYKEFILNLFPDSLDFDSNEEIVKQQNAQQL